MAPFGGVAKYVWAQQGELGTPLLPSVEVMGTQWSQSCHRGCAPPLTSFGLVKSRNFLDCLLVSSSAGQQG